MKHRKLSEEIFVQKQSFVLYSIKQNRNRILFFLLFVLYALLTVLGTTDKDFFFESGIKFPLLNIELPLIAFYVVVPISIIALHFNLVYLFNKHQKLLDKHKSIKGFYHSMPLGFFDMPSLRSGGIFLIIKIFTYLIIYILPLLTLYIFWWHFAKYQSHFYTSLHLFYIILDSIIIIYFLLSSRAGKIVSAFIVSVMLLAFALHLIFLNEQNVYLYLSKRYNIKKEDFFKYYPHLELSGEYLVKFDYSQLKAQKSLNPNIKLALLQPPLNLKNRFFKYANFKNALLIRVNLKNANLQNAFLGKANLKGSNLWKVNLMGACLEKADLQNVDLRFANLQGADLRKANLKGANLQKANLQGANLDESNLQEAYCINEIQGQTGKDSDLNGMDEKINDDLLND